MTYDKKNSARVGVDEGSRGAWTPGPWHYVTGPALKGRYHIVEDADGALMICECWDGDDDATQEANARLIAAAPQFADAARKAVTGNALMDGGEFVAIPREAYDAFRVLLRKIEGDPA